MRFLSENNVSEMRVDTRACTQITCPCVFLRINISASLLIIKICIVDILKIKTYQTTFMLCVLPTMRGRLEVAGMRLADLPSSRQATLCFHCASKFSQLNGSHTC